MDNSQRDDANALRYVAVITSLLVLGLLCFSARIWTRVYPSYWLSASDYVNMSAVALLIVTFSLFVASVQEGFGRRIQYLKYESIVSILRLLFFVRLIGTCGSTLARVSIALQLLPLSTSATWKAALWVAVAFEVAGFTALALYSFFAQPISENWDGSGPKGQKAVSYAFVGVSLVGDLWCSTIPLFLIWDLNRSILERYLLSLLMALGLCAAAAAMNVLVHLKGLQNNPDALRDTLQVYSWCVIEHAVLIVSSCAPLLKSLIGRALHRLGLPTFRNIPRELDSYHSNRAPRKPRWHITWMWRKRQDNPSRCQENIATIRDSGKGSKTPPSYTADSSTSDVDQIGAASSIQIENLEQSDRLA